jgi:hypothetical protein
LLAAAKASVARIFLAVRYLLVISLVALAGCGGGGDDEPGGPPAPKDLAYPSPQTYTVGQAIAPLRPTITGIATSYSVAPPLPSGLTLDTVIGVITGTPTTTAGAAGYVITARNESGSTTFTLTISVQPNVLRAVDDAANTVKGIATSILVMNNDQRPALRSVIA